MIADLAYFLGLNILPTKDNKNAKLLEKTKLKKEKLIMSVSFDKLTILSLNIWNGGSNKSQLIAASHSKSNKEVAVQPQDLEQVFKYIAELIYWKEADVVALQEVDKACKRTFTTYAPQRIAAYLNKRLQYNHPSQRWSHYFVQARKNGSGSFGNAILTKLKVKRIRRYSLEKDPSVERKNHEINREERAAICIRVSLNVKGKATGLWVINTHLGLAKYDQSHQINNLVKIINGEAQYLEKNSRKSIFSDADAAMIICGDFNIEDGTEQYAELLNTLNNSKRTDFRDLGPRKLGTFQDKKIDYVFCSDPKGYLGHHIKARVISSEGYSDHQALKITFSFKNPIAN